MPTPSCSLCTSQTTPLLCSRCSSHLVLEHQTKSIPVQSQIHTLTSQINNMPTQYRTQKAVRSELTLRKKRVLEKLSAVQSEIRKQKERVGTMQQKVSEKRKEVQALRDSRQGVVQLPSSGRTYVSTDTGDEIVRKRWELTYKLVARLSGLFLIRRSRRASVEVYICFVGVPDLKALVKQSPRASLNVCFDRVAIYTLLVSWYLGVSLPYAITPPLKHAPYVVMQHRHVLLLRKSARDVLVEQPREFERYATTLSMLVLDLAYLASKVGVHVESVLDMASILMEMDRVFATGKATQPISDNDIPETPDLEEVTDLIVTANFIEVNGGSAEWNLIGREETMSP